MKVLICKVFDECYIERICRLIVKERKRAGNSQKVFCTDERTKEKLELAGIASEVRDDFQSHYGAEDEPFWRKAYELSDELHFSVEKKELLKYSGINFLSYEYDITTYTLITKLTNLCRQAAEQKYQSLILILTEPYSQYFPDIDSFKIKTRTYRTNLSRFNRATHLAYRAACLGISMFRSSINLARQFFSRSNKGKSPVSSSNEVSQTQNALFIVSTPLYARPALAIGKACMKNGLTPYFAPYVQDIAPILAGYNIEFSNKINALATVSSVPNMIKALPLYLRLYRYVSTFESRRVEPGEFPEPNLCRKNLLHRLRGLWFIAVYYTVYLEKLVQATSPAVICLMPDGFFLQQTAAKIARKHGIPTLACSAALETGNTPSYMKHLHADKIAAMGENIKSAYLTSGLEPEKITVTGIAHFDSLFDRNEEQDSQTLSEQGIDPERSFIVFGTENLSISETIEALTGVIEAILKLKDIHLVVKVHPREDLTSYIAAAEKYRDPRIHVVKDIDLYALLCRCELLIVKFSTIALEAMMIGKPVVVINLPGQPTPVPYAEEGAALGVYKYEDIEPAIREVLYNDATRARLKTGRDKFVRAWAGEPDGKASQRIVKLMKEMIKSSKAEKMMDAATAPNSRSIS